MSGQKKTRARFVSEGFFVAMPLRFPSVSTGIAPDAAWINTLVPGPINGQVFLGLTGGTCSHVFAVVPGAPYGYALDLGTIAEAGDLTAVAWSLVPGRDEPGTQILVGGNDRDGGAVYGGECTFLSDGIQEWGFRRPAFMRLSSLRGERLLALWMDGSRLLCRTDEAVHLIAPESGRIVASEPFRAGGPDCAPGMAGNASGAAFRLLVDGDGLVHTCRAEGGAIALQATGCRLQGMALASLVLAMQGHEVLIAADGNGALQSWTLAAGRVRHHDPVEPAPVLCLGALPDGRIYGFCGDGIGRFFRSSLLTGETVDLGAVAAVHGARRYANRLTSVAVTPAGLFCFGENDRGGHAWLYSPPAVLPVA